MLHLLSAVVFFETVGVMVLWGLSAPWWRWPAGRSIMGLLGCIALLCGLAALSWAFGRYPGRELVYAGGYVLLILAIAGVGVTVVWAQMRGRR